MTPLADALRNLSEIHAHLAKGEEYRGITARSVLLSGLLGILAACLQPRLIPEGDAVSFVIYWLLVAVTCALAGASSAIVSYFLEDDALARRRARIVAGQLIPSLAAGVFITLAWWPMLDNTCGLLPGLWAMLYGLALFSTRPYLPRATGWVGLYFVLTGTALLAFLPPALLCSPWYIALTFAPGQFALALVLHRNAQRESPHA